MKTILVDAVDTLVIEGEGIHRPLYDFLETYPHKKIILTNANDEQVIQFGLTNLPYEIFSLKHNPDKIDPKYFEVMLKHFNLNSDEVVYFEHNIKAVQSAQSVGITSYYYDSSKRDLIDLKKFLDANLDQIAGNELVVVINRPVDVVFDFAIDPKNTPKWVKSVKVEETSEWPIKVGTIYQNKGSDDVWNKYKVVELYKNRVFTLESLDRSYYVRYTFESVSEIKTNMKYFEWVKSGDLKDPFGQDAMRDFKEAVEKAI